jgi:hypothetical protein
MSGFRLTKDLLLQEKLSQTISLRFDPQCPPLRDDVRMIPSGVTCTREAQAQTWARFMVILIDFSRFPQRKCLNYHAIGHDCLLQNPPYSSFMNTY